MGLTMLGRFFIFVLKGLQKNNNIWEVIFEKYDAQRICTLQNLLQHNLL